MPSAALILVAALALAVAAPRAVAEHTIDSRFVVLGFVKDGAGKLLRGHAVDVVRDKTGLMYHATTDAEGFFVVVMRLGNESAGETVTVRVGAATTTVTARFDPANHTDARGTRVDLEGTSFVERTSAFRPTLGRFLGNETR